MENKQQVNQSSKEKQESSAVETAKILEDINILKFVLDTNVIFAYLNSDNPFHFESKTVIDGLKTKKAWFVIPHVVVGEFIANRDLINKKISININKALDILKRFDTSVERRLVGGTPLNLQNIINIYKKHTRHNKLTKAGFADFIILAAADEIKNVRILTCDKDMYSRGKSIFKDRIYYLPNQTKSVKSTYPRLMSEIQNNFK